MAILVLNNYPLAEYPYGSWLEASTDEIILLTGTAMNSTEDIERAERAVSRLQRFDGYPSNGNLERVALEIGRTRELEYIVSLSEFDVCRAARLREALGLSFGQSVDSAHCFRDKLTMKQRLAAGGIPVARWAEVRHALDLVEFAEHGYPFVVKPRWAGGTLGFRRIGGPDELASALAEGFDGSDREPALLCEEYVSGPMFHVDGVVVGDRVLCHFVSKYSDHCAAFTAGQPLGSVLLDPKCQLARRLGEFVAQALCALPTEPGFAFHAEVFQPSADEFVLCEVASRAGGPPVVQTIRDILGVDLNRLSVQVQVGAASEWSWSAPLSPSGGWLMFPPQPGRLLSMPKVVDFDDIVLYQRLAKPGQVYGHAKHTGDAAALLVFQAESEAQAARRLAELQAWFPAQCAWEPVESSLELGS